MAVAGDGPVPPGRSPGSHELPGAADPRLRKDRSRAILGPMKATPILLAAGLCALPCFAGVEEPVQVFLLVGQSNMEGKGAVQHLADLIAAPATSAEFAHLMHDGEWVVRDDVWISYKRRPDAHATGGLTVGYGGNTDQIGPELGFGTVVGDALDAPVLLIKCAWGGASLREDFLSPGAGGPGGHYTRMLTETHEVLDDIGRFFEGYAGQGYELAGLVWFQGWNDHIGQGNPDYTEQLSQFIRDVRAEFDAPRLPVVIGELGQAGADTDNESALRFRAQQRAVADAAEFRGTVRYVPTGVFVDPVLLQQFDVYRACESAAKKLEDPAAKEAAWADWRKVEEEYSRRTSNLPYHYFGSGEIFYRMGDAFGRAMLELLEDGD